MNLNEMFIVLLFLIWGFALLLILVKKDFFFIWKSTSVLLYLLYFFLYYPALFKFYDSMSVVSVQSTGIEAFKAIMKYMPLLLVLLWPATLLSSFFLSQKQASNRVRTLTLFTLFFWILWLLGAWMGINLEDEIIKLGKEIKIPKLPDPPIH